VTGNTALVIDLDAGSATVKGLGGVTVRKSGRSTVFPAGSEIAVADLVAAARGMEAAGSSGGAAGRPAAPLADSAAVPVPGSGLLRDEVGRLEAIFAASLDECDAPAAVRAILTLEETSSPGPTTRISPTLWHGPVRTSSRHRVSRRDGRARLR